MGYLLYRVDPSSNPGVPDLELVQGLYTARIELKVIRGNPTLKNKFTKAQLPWYTEFFAKGGDGLLIVTRLETGYSVIDLTPEIIREIREGAKFKSIAQTEYRTLKELFEEVFG